MSEVAADKTQPVPGASAAPSSGHQPQAPQATHPQAHPLAQAHIQAAQAIKPPVVRNPLFRDPSKAPFRKLTVDLIRTYKHINTVYYAAKKAKKKEQAPTHNDGYDDENHDYIIKAGETIADRYEIKVLLGKGSFGQVAEAFDLKENKRVAVKIIKNKTAFRNQAKIEIKLLQEMNERDPNDQAHIVRMVHFFEHRHHLCIVFELLSFNLYELIRHTNFKGISLNLIRKFGIQLLEALNFLLSTDISVIHCDLKPENILLKSPNRTAIKVIDFGSSCKIGKTMYPYIQSRFYRSPEVLLQIPYTQAIDMWSLGCILFELHTGDPLFNGSNEVDQMMKMGEVLGMPPESMLEKGQKTKRYFARSETDGAYERIKTDKEYKPLNSKRLTDLIGANTDGPRGLRRSELGHSKANYAQFEDLLQRLLAYDPELRLTPQQALRHEFFTHPAHLATPSVPRPLEAPVSQSSEQATEATIDRPYLESPDMFKETASKKHLPVEAQQQQQQQQSKQPSLPQQQQQQQQQQQSTESSKKSKPAAAQWTGALNYGTGSGRRSV